MLLALYVATEINEYRLAKWSVRRDLQPSLLHRRYRGHGALFIEWPVMVVPLSGYSSSWTFNDILDPASCCVSSMVRSLRGWDRVLHRTYCARLHFSTQRTSTIAKAAVYSVIGKTRLKGHQQLLRAFLVIMEWFDSLHSEGGCPKEVVFP